MIERMYTFNMNKPVPVHILAGFLGSGKTTLLTQALDYYKELGQKPAVLMNEIGDVNLDGMQIGSEVPMTEMLSGCICCTIRGDLGMAIRNIVRDFCPDVLFIESTGAANPLEIIDGVTDASLMDRIELKSVVTVADSAHLQHQIKKGKGKTLRLMQDQLRSASYILLNKTDLVSSEDQAELVQQIRSWNAVAPIEATIKCRIDHSLFDRLDGDAINHITANEEDGGCTHKHDDNHVHDHSCGHHHSHDHVMAYTHFFEKPIDSERFEELLTKLPAEVYRAKGILRFTDTGKPILSK
jgi:G3E family GTPase